MIENKISIEGDETAKVLRGAMGHRATWMGLIYKKACEAGKGADRETPRQKGQQRGRGWPVARRRYRC